MKLTNAHRDTKPNTFHNSTQVPSTPLPSTLHFALPCGLPHPQVMSAPVRVVHPEMTAGEIYDLLDSCTHHGFPVVDPPRPGVSGAGALWWGTVVGCCLGNDLNLCGGLL